MPDDKVKAICVQRTEDAKAKVEHEIQEMRHEREQQIAATNKNVSELSTALTILTRDVTDLVGDAKTQKEREDSQDKLIAASQNQMSLILDWQKEELARHTREEAEKKAAIAKVETERGTAAATLEQQRKDRIRPFMDTVWKIIQWAAILALGSILNALWIQYFKK